MYNRYVSNASVFVHDYYVMSIFYVMSGTRPMREMWPPLATSVVQVSGVSRGYAADSTGAAWSAHEERPRLDDGIATITPRSSGLWRRPPGAGLSDG